MKQDFACLELPVHDHAPIHLGLEFEQRIWDTSSGVKISSNGANAPSRASGLDAGGIFSSGGLCPGLPPTETHGDQ